MKPCRFILNKFIKIACVVALCIALPFCISSCQQEKEEEYTVTFYYNTGIVFTASNLCYSNYQDNTVYKVEKISSKYPSEPTPPTNEGYVFHGWYQDPQCTEKFLFGHYEINSDINLYAKWVKSRG